VFNSPTKLSAPNALDSFTMEFSANSVAMHLTSLAVIYALDSSGLTMYVSTVPKSLILPIAPSAQIMALSTELVPLAHHHLIKHSVGPA
jgi:hypothetical protein